MLSFEQQLLEAVLLAAGEPLSRARLADILGEAMDGEGLDAALRGLAQSYAERGFELVEVAGGLRLQARERFAPWLARIHPERPARYSRAVIETLALIAWRQPITRAEIEAVRGVSLNPSIIRSLQERGWIMVVGRKDSPGRPELLGTTRQFLDDFQLASMEELARKVLPQSEGGEWETQDARGPKGG